MELAILGSSIEVTYTNHRGETGVRTIRPAKLWFGNTRWHPEKQWLLRAFDPTKGEFRDFALKDMRPAPAGTSPGELPTSPTALPPVSLPETSA